MKVLVACEESQTVCKEFRIAEEFYCWLEDISNKYKWDKDDVQFLIKQLLMCEVEE
jgi:hypothetical protein